MTQQWISVKTWMPGNKERALVFGELEGTYRMDVYTAKLYAADEFNLHAWMHAGIEVRNVTHWMPVPFPPGLEPCEEPMYQVGNGLHCTFKDNPPRVEPL